MRANECRNNNCTVRECVHSAERWFSFKIARINRVTVCSVRTFIIIFVARRNKLNGLTESLLPLQIVQCRRGSTSTSTIVRLLVAVVLVIVSCCNSCSSFQEVVIPGMIRVFVIPPSPVLYLNRRNRNTKKKNNHEFYHFDRLHFYIINRKNRWKET